jgi:hypothetical protein
MGSITRSGWSKEKHNAAWDGSLYNGKYKESGERVDDGGNGQKKALIAQLQNEVYSLRGQIKKQEEFFIWVADNYVNTKHKTVEKLVSYLKKEYEEFINKPEERDCADCGEPLEDWEILNSHEVCESCVEKLDEEDRLYHEKMARINKLDESGKKHGTWETFHPNHIESTFHHGELHGVYKKRYKSDKIHTEANFVMDKQEGEGIKYEYIWESRLLINSLIK